MGNGVQSNSSRSERPERLMHGTLSPHIIIFADVTLSQGETKHIRDYVHRVEKLSRKIPPDMHSLFAISFIKGMKDQEGRQRVTFDLQDSPNFSFVKALTVVKFSFQEIGEPDPFHPDL